MHSNLCYFFKDIIDKNPDKPSFFSKYDGEYRSITYSELYEKSISLSASLVDLGVKKGDKIALISDNRLEWIISSFSILFSGCLEVPRGANITDSEIKNIVGHSEPKILFIENDTLLKRLKPFLGELSSIQSIVLMDLNQEKGEADFTLAELIEKGKSLNKKDEIEKNFSEIKQDEPFTIIYTSGTTSEPKGVLLSHENMMQQISQISKQLNIENEKRFLSVLPIWHVYERVFCYYAIFRLGQTYYTNVKTIKEDFLKVRPHYIAAAPRLLESLYNGIFHKLKDAPPIKKFLFHTAYFYSKKFRESIRFFSKQILNPNDRSLLSSFVLLMESSFFLLITFPFSVSAATALSGFFLNMPFLYIFTVPGLFFNFYVLDHLIAKKIREKVLGGHLKAFICGGGALPKYIDEFFNNFGITVLEGYGLTETSPVISVRTLDQPILGTVGFPLPKTKIQIRNEENEILTEIKNGKLKGKPGAKGIVFVSGPQVMLGYYKNEQETKKIISNGWLNTGDIGFLSVNKTLTLQGRAKETIVLLNGENVEPVPIENKILESIYVNQVVLLGQDRKFITALIIPDFEHLKKWCKDNSIDEENEDKLIEIEKINLLYKKQVHSLSGKQQDFKSYESVKSFFLISKPFQVGEELTNLMKLKRNFIYEKYKDRIEKLYEN